MPSIVPGFEYDIFISYRHNDNRSGWVTEFVKTLQEELAATFKNPVSVYFDTNPHDGLSEHHDVDLSLKEKLRSLILIPVVSQTYCDPKSFAWKNEFLPFLELASKDQLGLKVSVAHGNVASRILPIRIHTLDNGDIGILEKELGGVLRGIEFTFKASGINRPLLKSDKQEENFNKAFYNDQINKVANAVKEIIQGITKPNNVVQSTVSSTSDFLKPEKSIVVLPFVNISNNAEQEYFSDGLTEELITELSRLNGLLVISRSSAMTFKGSNKKIKEIARDVNVRYVLEGSVRRAGNNLRITAQLIDATNDAHLWAENYNGVLEDVFDIQEKVSRAIVDSLKLKLDPEADQAKAQRPIINVHAYECYLKARQEIYRGSKESMDRALELIQNGLEIVGPNEMLYAALGYANYFYYRFVNKLDNSYLLKAEDCAKKIFELNPSSSDGHVISGWIYTTHTNLQESVRSMKRALKIEPNNHNALSGLVTNYIWAGQSESALPIAMKLLEMDPLTSFNHIVRGGLEILSGKYEEGLVFFEKAYQMDSQSPVNIWQLASAYFWYGRNERALPLIDQLEKSAPEWPITKQVLFLKFGILGDKQRALEYATEELEKEASDDHHFAFHLAECYAVINEKEKALDLLEHAIQAFYPYRFILKNPLLDNIVNENRFKQLIQRAKEKTESFEV